MAPQTGYHVANWLLHALASALVFDCARALLATDARLRGGSAACREEEERQAVALVSGLLFAVHPAHTEAVCNTVGRAELLSAAGALLCLRVYAGATTAAAGWRLPAALTLGLAAALCKETGAMVLAVAGVSDLLLQPPFATGAAGLRPRAAFCWRAVGLALGFSGFVAGSSWARGSQVRRGRVASRPCGQA